MAAILLLAVLGAQLDEELVPDPPATADAAPAPQSEPTAVHDGEADAPPILTRAALLTGAGALALGGLATAAAFVMSAVSSPVVWIWGTERFLKDSSDQTSFLVILTLLGGMGAALAAVTVSFAVATGLAAYTMVSQRWPARRAGWTLGILLLASLGMAATVLPAFLLHGLSSMLLMLALAFVPLAAGPPVVPWMWLVAGVGAASLVVAVGTFGLGILGPLASGLAGAGMMTLQGLRQE